MYNCSLELGLFIVKFRTLARYDSWNDGDCLLALSVSVEGPAPYSLFLWGDSDIWGDRFPIRTAIWKRVAGGLQFFDSRNRRELRTVIRPSHWNRATCCWGKSSWVGSRGTGRFSFCYWLIIRLCLLMRQYVA